MHSIQANSKQNSAIDSADDNKTRLIRESNILLPSNPIAVLPAKSTRLTDERLDKFKNVIVNPFLCIESHSLCEIPMACIFPEKVLNAILILS